MFTNDRKAFYLEIWNISVDYQIDKHYHTFQPFASHFQVNHTRKMFPITFCFQREQRDMVTIVHDSYVEFYMAGPGSMGHVLTDRRTGGAMTDTQMWVQNKINEGLGKSR